MMPLDPDCPTCDLLATLPDFDDPLEYDKREAAVRERHLAGGSGYGYLYVGAPGDTYAILRAALRHHQQRWEAVMDCGDGTFVVLVASGRQEELDSLCDLVATTVHEVVTAGRFEPIQLVVTALGTEVGDASRGASIAFDVLMRQAEEERRPRAPGAHAHLRSGDDRPRGTTMLN